MKSKKVTILGGGTGGFVVLSGLKKYPLDLAVVVNMMDSGGSTGLLRDQLGVLPPGDLRQCLIALSEAPILWRELFLYRFESGDLAGHNFGNIFLSALEKVSANYEEVVKTASFVLKTKGEAIPVTFSKSNLAVEYEDGKVIVGEGNIDEHNSQTCRIKKAFLEPPANPNDRALERIAQSDYLIIGPGDLYTSIISILLVSKIKKAIQSSKSKIIYIMNLMTKFGQTNQYRASDHLRDLSKYLGRIPDGVIVNDGHIPKNILNWYLEHHESVVEQDVSKENYKGWIIRKDLLDLSPYIKKESDILTRSILRHDSEKLAKVLIQLIQ